MTTLTLADFQSTIYKYFSPANFSYLAVKNSYGVAVFPISIFTIKILIDSSGTQARIKINTVEVFSTDNSVSATLEECLQSCINYLDRHIREICQRTHQTQINRLIDSGYLIIESDSSEDSQELQQLIQEFSEILFEMQEVA